jgi:hypothetical protein
MTENRDRSTGQPEYKTRGKKLARKTGAALAYLSGADYLNKHFKYQQRLLRENTGRNEPLLPTEGDLKTAAKVYADTARMSVGYPIVLAGRVTGVDAAIKQVRKQLKKEADK